jgi:hypothetical protein
VRAGDGEARIEERQCTARDELRRASRGGRGARARGAPATAVGTPSA